MTQQRKVFLVATGVVILANAGLAIPFLRYGAAFVLLWILPGCAWAMLICERGLHPTVEDAAIGLGLGLASVTLLTLLLHYIPGPLETRALLVAIDLVLATLIVLGLRRSRHETVPQLAGSGGQHLRVILPLLIVVLIAVCYRVINLGYSEFQGDEGVIMGRAARVLTGDDAQLFYHHKGPPEILFPTATWALSGTINEWQARLPLACSGVLGVVGFYLLAQRWMTGRGALIAALLLSINGFFIGFGRIVQYQNLVFAGVTLGMLSLWRWSQNGGIRWLFAGTTLLAFAMLAHYEAILMLPIAAFVVGQRLWVERRDHSPIVWHVLGAGALAVVILLTFYLPYVLSPSFSRTLSYLTKSRMSDGGPLYNNLVASLPLNTFYNSTIYFAGVALLVMVAVFRGFRGWWILVPVCVLMFLSLTQITDRLSLVDGPVIALLLGLIILSRWTSPEWVVIWLWFSVPFVFYHFLVGNPITHILNAFPGALLLAASVLDRGLDWIGRKAVRRVLNVTGLAVFVFLAYYPYLMFVQHQHEIVRTWPEHAPSAYWRPFEEKPYTGFFGFPYQAGWKAVGVLARQGVVTGSYASNEELETTGWYAPELEHSFCPGPDWYIISRNVQDVVPTDQQEIESQYHLWGQVQVDDETKLWIYRRGSTTDTGTSYDARHFVADYDSTATARRVVTPSQGDYVPVSYTLGSDLQLVGYSLNTANSRPGGSVRITLYWDVLRPTNTVYQVFNHLYDGSEMWGQKDNTPGCGLWPTPLWNPGQIVRDDYIVPISLEAPAGEIPILTGMYNLIGPMERLPVYDANGDLIGDVIPLAKVNIR